MTDEETEAWEGSAVPELALPATLPPSPVSLLPQGRVGGGAGGAVQKTARNRTAEPGWKAGVPAEL